MLESRKNIKFVYIAYNDYRGFSLKLLKGILLLT